MPLEWKQNTALWGSCFVKVVLDMFYVEEEIVTFTFCSPGVALNSKALSRSFVFGTEDRSLKAYFYIFISLQTFIQFKKNVRNNKTVSGAT